MKKRLFSDHQAKKVLINQYPDIKQKELYTPFGKAQPIYSNKILKPRTESVIGSDSYRTSLSRAFNRVKQQLYFNTDMTQFVTLTYADNMQDIKKLSHDVKILIKKQKNNMNGNKIEIKYAYTVEKQKRGALHVHMICTPFFNLIKNKNGYNQIEYWKHGYSSVLDVRKADKNFKHYLYLFKYMNKSQRIGKSFIHTSNNLNNFEEYPYHLFDKKLFKLTKRQIDVIPMIDRKVEKRYYDRIN